MHNINTILTTPITNSVTNSVTTTNNDDVIIDEENPFSDLLENN